MPLDDYFTGYRRTVRGRDELIRAVRIPLPLSEVTAFHKIAKRRFDDISSVAVAHRPRRRATASSHGRRIGLGGVAATPVRATRHRGGARGTAVDDRRPCGRPPRCCATEGTPIDDHRASAAYRSAMLGTALLRLHADAACTRPEVGP